MKEAEFLREIEALSKQISATMFAGEIWIGRVTRERMLTQDTVSRAELISDLNALLAKHHDHPSFPKSISQALEKLGE